MPTVSKLPVFTLAVYLAYTAVPGVAYAQSAVRDAVIEEVVVTAQRKEQSVQDVPIAITALSEDALRSSGVTSTRDLQMVTPGLTYGRQLSSAVPFIRGIGTQTTSAGQDASVSTYVDDVYYSQSTGAILTLANIERIEVLKGPQGTLFGRNATGGLMHVITKDPSQETSANIELSYGDYDTTGANFYGTTGISDSVAADLSIYYKDQGEGFGDNTVTGNDVNATEELLLRSKWEINLSDTTDIKLAFDYSDTETSQGVSQRMAPGTLGADGLFFFTVFTTPVSAGGLGLGPAAAAPLAASMATGFSGDYYDVNATIDPLAEIEQWGASIRVDHSFGELEFTSITAYRESDGLQTFSQDQTVTPNLLGVSLDEYTETFTQEFRLSASTENFDWIAGLYLLDEEAAYDNAALSGLFLAPLSNIVDTAVQETFSWAVFAQADFSLAERTTLTTGLRYTKDDRDFSGNSSGLIGGAPILSFDYSDSETFSELTWRLALSHEFNESTMGYVSYNRGFKAGLYNTVVLNPATGPAPAIEPEILDAYEVGLKTDFAEGRVRLNAAAFYYQYDDLQVSISTPGGNTILNAAEATMWGAEFEMQAALTPQLSLYAGLSLLDTEYDDFPNGPVLTPTGFGGNAPSAGSLAGNEVPRSPDFTYNLGAVYSVETEIGGIDASVHYYYNDGFYWESENRTEEDSYSLVNAQVTWTSLEESWYVRLFVNNLTDEEYSQFGISSQFGDFISASEPRTWGVKVGVNL